MANELQSLNLLFQNKLFRIPDYQRGYAWLRPHLVDFWEDLLNLQVDHYHYTGMLSLKELKRKDIESWGTDLWMLDKDFKPCHIVDGQQRITTFIILLNEIISFVRSAKENIGKSDDEIVLGCTTLKEVISKYICQVRPPQNLIKTYLFGYENDNPSSEYLKYKIFNEPFSGTINETYYTKNLKIAKEFFRDNIQALYDAEGIDAIDAIYLKLTQKLMFNIHDIKDDYDVFVAFETMNNRGKKLTNLELLKNRLIYLTTLYSDDIFDEYEKKDLRNQINDTWKEVYYQLGRNELIPLSDDEFLRAHWIIYFSYSRRKGDDYIKFLLNKFSAKNIFEKIVVSVNSETDFENNNENDIDEITEDEDNNIEPETITVTKLAPKEISDYINSLKDMAKYWYDTYFPQQSPHLTNEEKIWVDKLNRIGIGHFRPLVAVIISLQHELPENKIKAFQAIERFIFIFFRMGYYNASYRSSEYYRMTRSLYFGEIRLDDFIQDIEDITSSNVELVIPPFIAKIEKHFKDADGYYSWNTIKYFLYEYEFSLAQKNNIDKVTWEMFTKSEKDKISIVGESGQGKSTFLSLFCRFYDIDDKNYLTDGTPTSKTPDIAYISQESDLFDLTIKENLCLGKRISNETLNEYLKDAGLDEWINDLENGLDTLVGEKGIKLSAGQKQRLNIIRGILLDKEIYILDEPTSNLDSLSENKIYDMINKYLKNKTCLIVTHRPKLTEICNKHYYFDKRVMIEK